MFRHLLQKRQPFQSLNHPGTMVKTQWTNNIKKKKNRTLSPLGFIFQVPQLSLERKFIFHLIFRKICTGYLFGNFFSHIISSKYSFLFLILISNPHFPFGISTTCKLNHLILYCTSLRLHLFFLVFLLSIILEYCFHVFMFIDLFYSVYSAVNSTLWNFHFRTLYYLSLKDKFGGFFLLYLCSAKDSLASLVKVWSSDNSAVCSVYSMKFLYFSWWELKLIPKPHEF